MYKRSCLDHFRQGGDASYVDDAVAEATQRWRAAAPTPGDSMEETWMPNKSSPVCLLCVGEFSFFTRRHHCRRCGVLCDAACSEKHVSAGGKLSRVCDCCFNELRYRAAKASAVVSHVDATGSPRGTRAAAGGPRASVNKGTVYAQNVDRAQERGRAISRMGDKVDTYKHEGRTFRSMTEQLSRQYSGNAQ
jgi:hypothetical protein